MDFCITDLIRDFMYCFFDLFLRTKFHSTYQLCLIFAVKLQLSPAYRLHVVDINGISSPYNGLIT